MILDVIVEDKKKRLVEHKNTISEEDMKQEALNLKRQSISLASYTWYSSIIKSFLIIGRLVRLLICLRYSVLPLK